MLKELQDDLSLDDDFSDEEHSPDNEIELPSRGYQQESCVNSSPMNNEAKPRSNTYKVPKNQTLIDKKINLHHQFSNFLRRPAISKGLSVDCTFTKIYDSDKEIQQLKDELRVSNNEIQRLMLTKQVSIDESSSTYHLAFMFASPLMRKVNKNLEMIMQLDYQNEIAGIEKQLKDVKHEILYKVEVATISNFRSVIADAPFALHFTGHGIENDKKSLGAAYELYKNKGNILLLEDENGMADYLFENDLKRLVEISKANRPFSHNYEVVFVSSCHSEFAGRIFLASGAHHVI